MFLTKLILKTNKLQLLQQINLLTYTSLIIDPKIPSVLNLESSSIKDSYRPGITINIFHAIYIIDGNKITSMIIMWYFSSNPTSLCIGYRFDGYPWQLLSTMKHIPFLTKISNNNTRIPKLTSIHDNSLLFLLPDCLIDGYNPAQIIDITEYYYIVF